MISLALNSSFASAVANAQNDETTPNRTSTTGNNKSSVLLTPKTAKQILDNAVNMEDITQAKVIYQNNGEIVLSGSKANPTTANKSNKKNKSSTSPPP